MTPSEDSQIRTDRVRPVRLTRMELITRMAAKMQMGSPQSACTTRKIGRDRGGMLSQWALVQLEK